MHLRRHILHLQCRYPWPLRSPSRTGPFVLAFLFLSYFLRLRPKARPRETISNHGQHFVTIDISTVAECTLPCKDLRVTHRGISSPRIRAYITMVDNRRKRRYAALIRNIYAGRLCPRAHVLFCCTRVSSAARCSLSPPE